MKFTVSNVASEGAGTLSTSEFRFVVDETDEASSATQVDDAKQE